MPSLSLFDAPLRASRPARRHVATANHVAPDRIATGCCLASMSPVNGWNFNCFGNGYITLYQCGCGGRDRVTYAITAALAKRLRQIASATGGGDKERTRRVLELFEHPAVRQ